MSRQLTTSHAEARVPYVFTPPSEPRPMGVDRLWSRYRFQVGQAVLKKDGFYRQVEVVSDEDFAAADAAYLGGCTYRVSPDEASSLVAAGFGDGVRMVSASYGSGRFGDGPFGGEAYG